MKQFLFFSFVIGCCLIACNDNDQKKAEPSATIEHSDSADAKANADTAKKDTSRKTVKASATLTSDSLTPGKTTAESWKNAGFTDPNGFKAFFKKYQAWVASDNVDSITAHIRFPLRNCKSAPAFRKQYSTFFNSKVKSSVANQDIDKFFANYNGAMTGDGELWFNEINGHYFVITINNKM